VRTTLTIDDDLAARLRQSAHERGVSFKAAVNEALRAGLDHPAESRVRFRQRTQELGPARVDLTKAAELVARLEDEERVRKLELGR
jgi:hypothetical protein